MTWGQPLEVLSVLDLEGVLLPFLSAIACNSRWDLGTTSREQPLAVQEQDGSARCSQEPDLSLMISSTAQLHILDLWYSPTDCHNFVAGINKGLSAYCTEDPDTAPWI